MTMEKLKVGFSWRKAKKMGRQPYFIKMAT